MVDKTFDYHFDYLKKRSRVVLREFEDFTVGADVVDVILDLKRLNFYNNVIKHLKINIKSIFVKKLNLGHVISHKTALTVPMIKMAYDMIKSPFFYPLSKKNLVSFYDFILLYKFIELVYFMNVGVLLEKEDLKRIYFSGIDKKIIFCLDNFDNSLKNSDVSEQFFHDLKNIKWENGRTKLFFQQLCTFKSDLLYDFSEFGYFEKRGFQSSSSIGSENAPLILPTFSPPDKRIYLFFGVPINVLITPYHILKKMEQYENPYFNFPATENTFLLLLAACSAIQDNRNKISENDILVAYKTYFKLLSTDISELIEDLVNEKAEVRGSYLVCDRCGGYYELQSGESPDDFSDTCDCGGKLKYMEDGCFK